MEFQIENVTRADATPDPRIAEIAAMKFHSLEEFRKAFPPNYNVYYPNNKDMGRGFDLILRILSDPMRRISTGVKEYELRKYVPRHTGLMFLLETSRVNAITGAFEFNSYVADTVDNLRTNIGKRATTPEKFDRYFEGKDFGVAIKIDKFEKIKRPISIDDLYNKFPDLPPPPQPLVYLYTPVGSDLSNFLRERLTDIAT